MLRKTLIFLTIATALSACGKGPKDPAKPDAATAQANGKQTDGKPVRLLVEPEDVLTMQSNAVASGPVVTGSIQPERKADLRAEIPAVVLQVLKENGEHVKRGDVLVKLDETSIRDSVTSAQEGLRASVQALDQSQRSLDRLKTLRAEGMTSAQAVDDAEVKRNNVQSDVSAAKARLAAARQQLDRTIVRAPFDGIVSDRKVSNGDTASIGKELLKVIDPTSMRLEGEVSADKVGVVKVGQPVLFRVNGYGEQQFPGVVRRVDASANGVTRQVEVLVGFTGANQPHVAGLYAEGRIDPETSDALTLPESAVVKAGGKTYAWRIKGNALAKTDLNVGARDPRTGSFEIEGGLSTGDMVLRHPNRSLKDGQKVKMAAAIVASVGTQAPDKQ